VKPTLPYPRWLVALLCLAGILVVYGLVFAAGIDKARAGADDFLGLYASARLAGTPGIYDANLIRQVQLERAGVTGESLHFSTRLPCFPLLLWPLAQLPYSTAHAIWYGLRFVAVAVFVLAWPHAERSLTALVCCWSMPLAAGLANGQDAPLLLLWIGLAAWLEETERPFAGGLALSLCAAKFHLFLLLPLVLWRHRRWRVLQGGLTGGIVLAVLCWFSGGWDWPVRYIRAISGSAIHPNPQLMPNLHGFLADTPSWLEVVLSLLVVGGALILIPRTDYFTGLAIALGGSLLISYHAYTADAVTLVPAALLLIPYAGAAVLRYLAIAVSTPIPWLLLLRRG
jgi:hypothetical protein